MGDSVLRESDWRALTVSPRKRELFVEDLYFRETWEDLVRVAGERAAETLGPLAMLAFKPDGVVGRRMRRTLSFVEEEGFELVGFERVRYNRHSMRELWRWDWNLYTTDRLALSSLMHSATDTFLLLLRDTAHTGVTPGTVRLADLKGSVLHPWGPRHLRSVLRAPNKVIKFCHVADEPADLVRELGILLDRESRRELLRGAGEADADKVSAALLEEVGRLEAATVEHGFDIDETLERLTGEGRLPKDAEARIREVMAGGPRMSFDELAATMPPATDGLALWDFVLVASWVTPLEREGHVGLLPAPTAADWQGRHAPGTG
ncbi:hypothetical protein AB0E77_20170 [Streptomyces sp. NPDC032940]|uniref:hypothetical protein n=1 Tax=Streptomyces sp. NPDC032940 TaxID=3155366 RepID=UPI0033C5CEEB